VRLAVICPFLPQFNVPVKLTGLATSCLFDACGQLPAQKVLRSSTAFSPPQVLDEDPQDESGAARNTQLAVQAFDMRVDRMRRNTELDRNRGLLLVVENRLHDLGLPLGELKRSREEAPDVVGKYQVSRRPDGSWGEQSP
jgi:hypothetical protein